MSDEFWPEEGPGLTAYDPAVDGVSSKHRKERPGSPGPGRSSSRPVPPNKKLYRYWQDLMEIPAFGKRTKITVTPAAWNKGIKRLRDEGLSDDQIARCFQIFASDVRSQRVGVSGKEAFWVFMRRWHAYADKSNTRAAVEKVNPADSRHTVVWTDD